MVRSKLQITLPQLLKEKVIAEAERKEISTSLWVELLIKKQLESMKKNENLLDLGF